ncbi:MAG: peptidase T [Treponema sp.]|nr:peptidase T [Treponema sp.]
MKFLKNNSAEEKELLERFVKYAKIWSTSSSESADQGIQPSTPQQMEFAKILAAELESLGLKGIKLTEHGYVYAYLDSSPECQNVKPFALLAHMDTVEEASGKDVKPNIIPGYDGSVIQLKDGIVLDPEKIPALKECGKVHDTVITTDGTTLLGGDDKAGVAAIVTAMNYLICHPEIRHGKIEVIFSPDEETGHGMDNVPADLIESKFAYTVDGSAEGELECECFNAFKSVVTFKGVASHTNNARANGMVNAISMASYFVNGLPRNQAPETTDGRLGFFCPLGISGSMEEASVSLFLRDFDMNSMNERKAYVNQLAKMTESAFGGKVSVEHIQQYLNMKDIIDRTPYVKDVLEQAYRHSGVEPEFTIIRGGTDGSRLTEMGIPTPNIFTGAYNYHSPYEWVSLSQMLKATDILIGLSELIAK